MDRDTGSSSDRHHLLWNLFFNGMLLPTLLLGVLYVASRFVGPSFSSLIMLLTVFTTIGLLSGTGWGQRSAASSRVGVLFQRADQAYVKDISDGRQSQLPVFTRILIVFLMATIYGWILLVLSYLGHLPVL